MLEHYLSLAVKAIFIENMALAFFLGMETQVFQQHNLTGLKRRSHRFNVVADAVRSHRHIPAKQLGLDLDERGNIKADASFRTSQPKIYAAGDGRACSR